MLVAIDGIRVSAEMLNALLKRRASGDRVHVHAFRRDELMAVDLELAAPPLDTCYLSLQADASQRVLVLRSGWLGST